MMEKFSVWYSSDKHVLRTKHGRLHSISSVSSLWYGQEYVTTPKNTFSDNESFKRIRFGNKSFNGEVHETVYTSNLKIPNKFKKFCNLNKQSVWVSEIAADQFGNKLKSYYGFSKVDNKLHCVYQELDEENFIKWIYL